MAHKDPEKRRAYIKEWQAANREKVHEYARKHRAVHREEVREQGREYARRQQAENPEKKRAANRRWYATHREAICKRARQQRADQPGLLYNLTSKEYDTMMVTQGRKCAICGHGDKRLCIDHDHSTGTIRGLLCRKCNGGIGLLQDNPSLLRKAAGYLERGQK